MFFSFQALARARADAEEGRRLAAEAARAKTIAEDARKAAAEALARAEAEAEGGRRAAAEAIEGQIAAQQRASVAEALTQATREEVARLSKGKAADSRAQEESAASSRSELLAEITRLQRFLEEARSADNGSKLTVEKLRMELAAAEAAAGRVSADLKRTQDAADRQAEIAAAAQERLQREITQLRLALDTARDSDANSKIMARQIPQFV